MLSRPRYAIARAALRMAAPFTGLRLIDDHEPADVFIVGFPKSGHTWLQYLLASLAGGIDVTRAPDSLVQDVIPDVYARVAYRRYREPTFFKSHALPRKDYRRVIYLVRDGRDAMVSWFHHHQAVFGPMDFPTLVRTAPHLEARWHEHVEAWLKNPFQAELLVVRYEVLRRTPVEELARIAAFAGIEAAAARLEAAVSAASFEKQKQREAKHGWEDPMWPKDKSFVRRGTVGSYRDEMPPEALAAFIAEAGPTLRSLGYAIE
ncbi:MAG TPA: sulfotransferase domain-containing protein [Opitutaceae bacterium]|nr:sulfotransferase domain-containing protein [Opitutaceae bacterium]